MFDSSLEHVPSTLENKQWPYRLITPFNQESAQFALSQLLQHGEMEKIGRRLPQY
jgi:hypothetical protein